MLYIVFALNLCIPFDRLLIIITLTYIMNATTKTTYSIATLYRTRSPHGI